MDRAEGTTGSTVNLAGGNTGGQVNSRLLLILVVVLGVVAIIAVIMAAVAVGRPAGTSVTVQGSERDSSTNDGSAAKTSQSGKRIWSIANGHNYGVYEYIDKQGYLAGFSYDLIKAVCEAADMECRTIWDKYTNCWDSEAGEHSMGGQGLLDGWYDACMDWSPTIERTHVFSFSESYRKAFPAQFYVAYSDTTFDPQDITGKKIGFLDGWSSDEKCVARQSGTIKGAYIKPSDVVHVKGPQELIDKIVNGEIAAGFSGEENMREAIANKVVKQSGGDILCKLGGNGVMTRQDSSFLAHWNEGFRKIKANGVYQKICDSDTHSAEGAIECVTS